MVVRVHGILKISGDSVAGTMEESRENGRVVRGPCILVGAPIDACHRGTCKLDFRGGAVLQGRSRGGRWRVESRQARILNEFHNVRRWYL